MHTDSIAFKNRTDSFPRLIWLWMILSSLVFFEPSPYDVIFIVCFVGAVLLSKLSFSSAALLPFVTIGIYVNSNLISMFFSGNIVNSTGYFLKTMYLIGSWALLVGLLHHYRRMMLEVIFSAYLAAAIVSASVGIAAYFQLIPNADLFLWYGRISGTFKDPNVFGPFLIPAVIYSFFLFESETGIKRLLWLGVSVLLSVGVVLCFSRAAWGNFFISAFVYFFLPAKVSLKNRICTVIMLLLLIMPIIFVVINHPSVNSLFHQRTRLQAYDDNRFGTQLASMKLAFANPLGVGPGQSEALLSYAPHNLYVRIITENGVLGIFSFVNFIFLIIIRCLKNFKNNQYYAVIFAVLIGIMFNSLFVDTLHWRHLWIILALPWISIEPGFSSVRRPL